jgi:endonuclease/exonuclease/phosphatase family metal-dependent hydrolase
MNPRLTARIRGARRAGSMMAAVLALGLAAATPAAAAGTSAAGRTADAATSADASHHHPRVVVMTRNLYLGANLAPALTATDAPSFLGAVARIYGTARFTDFPTRAQAIADEIATTTPDLIGLQEVSRWETTGPGAPSGIDFLEVLTGALAARGLHYTAASTSANANIGPIPLVQPCASTTVGACTVTLKDRDVILVNADRHGLRVRNPRNGNYTAQQSFTPPIPGAAPVSFRRGWASVEGRLDGVAFHFANTHLETEDFPGVQEAQAAEFLAGPARGRGADIAAGDFNSAADGSTTGSYALLTKRFRDAWSVNPGDPGLTAGQNETLSNPVSQLNTRIDLVLTHGAAKPLAAKVIGATPFRATAPLWASDHAGVVTTLRLGC